jgi:ASCH domain
MTTLKAFSVRQPFANLIVRGIKPIENRVWQTPYRGLVENCCRNGNERDDRRVSQNRPAVANRGYASTLIFLDPQTRLSPDGQ